MGRWSGGAIENGIEDYRGGVAAEGRAAGGHFVENGAEAENIGAGVEIFAASLLGRHVDDCSDGRARAGDHRFVLRKGVDAGGGAHGLVGAGLCGVFGEAEIENFCLAARSDEDIRGLDIAMNYAAGMSGVERVGNLNGEIEERGKSNWAAADSLAERLAFEKLHDEKRAAIRFAYIEERADAGMIERGDGAGFALKAFEHGGIVSEFAGEKFQRDEAAETDVFGAEDLAHAAAAERFDDAIMRECLADQSEPPGSRTS